MENSRFVFSVFVGVSLLVVGAVIFAKSPIGIALMLLGVTLVGLSIVTRNIRIEEDLQPVLIPISNRKR